MMEIFCWFRGHYLMWWGPGVKRCSRCGRYFY